MRLISIIALSVALTGCEGLYNSPSVIPGESAVGEVQVVELSSATVRAANNSTYRPRTLPALFARSAGVQGSARGTGALPDGPFTPETRPTGVQTRLPPAVAPGVYHIGVGDVLVLATPNSAGTVEALTGLLAAQNRRQGYTVQDDGAITIPEVGRIRLDGLSLEDAEAEIFQALVAKQIDPTFSIEIAEFNSQSVSVGGAVSAPKTIPITLKPLTLGAALTATGGIDAKSQEFAVIHVWRDGQLYQVPLTAYLRDSGVQSLRLKDGDAIFVDTAYDLDAAQGYFAQQIQLATLRQSARQSVLNQLSTEVGLRRQELEEQRQNWLSRVELDAIERDYVYIAGEVGVQNRFTMPFERKAFLADALFKDTEGVPNRTGSIAGLYVLRANADGLGVTAWHLNAVNAANLVLATKFELRPDDVIFVSEQPVTVLDRFVSQIAPSIAVAQSF